MGKILVLCHILCFLLRQRRQIFHQPVMFSLDAELPSGTTLYEVIPSVSEREAA